MFVPVACQVVAGIFLCFSNSLMASKKAQLKFNVGDRVLHKPAVLAAFKSALPPRTKLGVIEEIQYKSNRRGINALAQN